MYTWFHVSMVLHITYIHMGHQVSTVLWFHESGFMESCIHGITEPWIRETTEAWMCGTTEPYIHGTMGSWNRKKKKKKIIMFP